MHPKTSKLTFELRLTQVTCSLPHLCPSYLTIRVFAVAPSSFGPCYAGFGELDSYLERVSSLGTDLICSVRSRLAHDAGTVHDSSSIALACQLSSQRLYARQHQRRCVQHYRQAP